MALMYILTFLMCCVGTGYLLDVYIHYPTSLLLGLVFLIFGIGVVNLVIAVLESIE